MISIPVAFDNITFPFVKEEEVPQLKKQTSSAQQIQENPIDFVLMPSPYISTLAEDIPKIDEHKMLKYWEKHIIPKI